MGEVGTHRLPGYGAIGRAGRKRLELIRLTLGGVHELCDVLIPRFGHQFVRRANPRDLPVAKHRDAACHHQRLGHIVRHHDRRETEGLVQALELTLQAIAGDWIERAERFIQQHDPRSHRQRRAKPTRCR